jgi:hypothetical protein
LAAIFGALFAYVYFYEIKGGEKRKEAERKAKLLFSSVEKDSITQILLQPAGIRLEKEEGEWVITEPIQAKTQRWAVDGIANSLTSARRERVIAENPADYTPYGLDPPAATVIFSHSGRSDTLHVGNKNATGTYVYVRLASSPEVLLTTTSIKYNAEKKLMDLRNKDVLTYQTNDVTKMEFRYKRKTFLAEKTSGKWKLLKPVEDEAETSSINKILNKIRNSRAKEFVDEDPTDLKKYGLHRPVATFSVYLVPNDAKKTLLIGKKNNDGNYYAKDEGRKPVFVIDSSAVAQLDVEASDLRSKDVVNFTTTDANRLELTYKDRRFVAVKDTSNNWKIIEPEERPAKSWKIATIFSTLNSAKAEDFAPFTSENERRYGLKAPQVRAVVKKDDDVLADLSLGKEKGDQVYALRAGRNAILLLKNDIVDKLTVNLEDLAEAQTSVEEQETDGKEKGN